MTKRDRIRSRLVAALCDRTPVDWARTRARHPDLAAFLDSLDRLQNISGRSRELIAELSAGTPRPVPEPTGAAPAPRRRPRTLFRWGPLRVVAKLGEGGFGEVFRAFDPALEREVALKLWAAKLPLDPGSFLAEARRLASVRHPNVLIVHGADVHDGRVGMWTDLLEGRNLEEWIMAEGPLAAREAAGVGMELCRALAAVHGAGLIHRDVKTTNVMREKGGRIVLMDFGAAAGRPGPGSRAAPGRVVGTPQTMAPEQLLGRRLTPAADVYGLGCLLYRLVTGRHPIEADTLAGLRARLRRGEITPLRDRRPDLPSDFLPIVERALAMRPADRYAGAGAMERALAGWLARQTSGPRPRRAPPRPPRPEPPGDRLPRPLTSFVGRESESAACLELLEHARLLTLTGPGGCGKTRLALRLAERWGGGGRRVAFADLGASDRAALLPSAVASVLGVREERDRDLAEVLADALARTPTLLILDNCEHLVAACARLAGDLLARCPSLRVLATSRQRLGVAGERIYVVPPLSLPDPGLEESSAASRSDAVRLFLERAALVRPVRHADHDLATVGRIVRQLDGLPLAIELAAARARVLSIAEIHERLGDRFRLLTGGGPSAAARHRTLRATIQWSYDLLAERERRVLRSLSVFAGGWTLAGAAAVIAPERHEIDVLDELAGLVDKSLVVVAAGEGGESRYGLLETVRQFAAERLEEAGETEAARDRHLDFHLALAEAAARGLTGPELGSWLSRLATEHENLLAALDGCEAAPDGAGKGLRLAGSLSGYWQRRGQFRLGRAALARALARAGADEPNAARARALFGAVRLALELAGARLAASDRERLEECLLLFRRFRDLPGISAALNQKGFLALEAGDHGGARAAFAEGLALAREAGDDWQASALLNNLGELARAERDPGLARAHYEEALALGRRTQDRVRVSVLLANLAILEAGRGDPAAARARLAESLEHARALPAPVAACTAIHAAAAVAAGLGERERAARWFGAAEAQWRAIGSGPERVDQETFAPILEALGRELGAEPLADARAGGAALPLETAVEETLGWARRTEPSGAGGPGSP